MVVGPRSAVFAPVSPLGLIIVDEEHDTGYKQDESPRYSARDVAVMRAHLEGARCVLGSATPSLESWRNAAELGKYALARLPGRVGGATLPDVALVDLREAARPGQGLPIFSEPLVDALKTCLGRGEQAILFLNRRGYAPTYQCGACGEPIACAHCSAKLTYHAKDDTLRCHLCGPGGARPTAAPGAARPSSSPWASAPSASRPPSAPSSRARASSAWTPTAPAADTATTSSSPPSAPRRPTSCWARR